MKCPNCAGLDLKRLYTKQGVEIDRCPKCGGIWLDEGEIFHFTRHPRVIADKLERAKSLQKPADKRSPATGKPMVELIYDFEINIDWCEASGGLWFDDSELKSLLSREKRLQMEFEEKLNELREQKPADERHYAARLLPLPNLFLYSTLSMVSLYAVLFLALITAVEFAGVNINVAVGIGLFIITIQFLLGPLIMDLSLRWLYKMQWMPLSQLPEETQNFVKQVCRQKNIKIPKFGVINDGAPQAFTYGHTPNNARIVISRGLFELLEPDEVNAVIAHEIGHAVHWDMLLMTLAQLVPLILYYIYRTLMRSRSGSRGRNNSAVIAIGAYVLYIVTEYVVLWLSRTREYHADRFSGEVTGNPSLLAAALVKIAYGLAGGDHEDAQDETNEKEERQSGFEAIGALGIFNADDAKRLAVSAYSEDQSTVLDKDTVIQTMRWDLWNPWAKWYQFNSTHPLVAKRLLHLSNQAMHTGQAPFVEFDETPPESYWDEFMVDLMILLLPIVPLVGGIILAAAAGASGLGEPRVYLAWASLLTGVGILIKYQFVYRGDFFPRSAIAGLLKKIKVSGVRPVPCKVVGTVIGRGVPGYIFSEDFVIKDNSGIIFLDYRQPLAIWEFLFSIFRRGEYDNKEVEVIGWYRRSPMPYIEVKELNCDGKTIRSWVPFLYRLSGIVLVIVGLILL